MKIRYKDDRIVSVSPGRKFLMDGFDVVRKPDGYAVRLVDLSAARRFSNQYAEVNGEKAMPVFHLPLIIKACSLALKKYPWVNYMLRGHKVVQPSSIDIGISVAGEENVAPVVVIREAATKSLQAIAQELFVKSIEAKKQEKDNLKKLDSVGRWIPFSFVRRKLVDLFINNQRVRRELVGTFQITSLSNIDFFFPAVLSSTALLGVGGVANRCLAVGEKVEVRPTVYLSLVGDHRVLDGVKAVDFLNEVKRLLENPHELKD
jgi:pyruvate dehydrogenase E2 component (dihydrolipoamide acetyltransferase)